MKSKVHFGRVCCWPPASVRNRLVILVLLSLTCSISRLSEACVRNGEFSQGVVGSILVTLLAGDCDQPLPVGVLIDQSPAMWITLDTNVQFDARVDYGYYDPSVLGDLVYEWDFGDGSSASGLHAGHQYTTSGLYTVTLRVTDSRGRCATTENSLHVQPLYDLLDCNNPPAVEEFWQTPDYYPRVEDDIEFEPVCNLDCPTCHWFPDLLDALEYEWDFGDGASAYARRVSHRFGRGEHTVWLTVTEWCDYNAWRRSRIPKVFRVAGYPTISTQAASGITETSAWLQGRIDDDGGWACQWRFRYRNSETCGWRYTRWTGSGTSGQSFSELITDLAPGSTYYFEAQVRHDVWPTDDPLQAWGGEQSFTTAPAQWPPAPWAEGWSTIYAGPWRETTLPPQELPRVLSNCGVIYEQCGVDCSGTWMRTVTSSGAVSMPLPPEGYIYKYSVIPCAASVGNWYVVARGATGASLFWGPCIQECSGCEWLEWDPLGRQEIAEAFWAQEPLILTIYQAGSGSPVSWGIEITPRPYDYAIVHTQPASDIGGASATLHGFLAADGGAPRRCAFRYWEWDWPDAHDDQQTPWSDPITERQSFSAVVTGLTPSRVYRFVAVTWDGEEGEEGEELTFRAGDDGGMLTSPVVSTQPADRITATSAALWGRVENDGGEACHYRFRYWDNVDGFWETDWTASATSGQLFSQNITGLKPATTYYFYAEVLNGADLGRGDYRTFTTPPAELRVSTLWAVQIGQTSATLVGQVESDGGQPCQYAFYYYQQANPSARVETPWWCCVTMGDMFTEVISGLTPGTQYRFVAQLKNATGMVTGDELTFTTLPGSLQEAIRVAPDGATIVVGSGRYVGGLDLQGKSIEIQGAWLTDPSAGEPPVIEGPVILREAGGDCVLAGLTIDASTAPLWLEGGNPLLTHCVIWGHNITADGGAVIDCRNTNVSLVNCTVTGNLVPSNGATLASTDSHVVVVNSILWGNTTTSGSPVPAVHVHSGDAPQITYSDVEDGWPGEGNIDADPLFVAPGTWTTTAPGVLSWVTGDCHLLSTRGYYSSGSWVIGAADSPCIDAGDPAADWGLEPMPNGGRINLGAYGGTRQASLSPE